MDFKIGSILSDAAKLIGDGLKLEKPLNKAALFVAAPALGAVALTGIMSKLKGGGSDPSGGQIADSTMPPSQTSSPTAAATPSAYTTGYEAPSSSGLPSNWNGDVYSLSDQDLLNMANSGSGTSTPASSSAQTMALQSGGGIVG